MKQRITRPILYFVAILLVVTFIRSVPAFTTRAQNGDDTIPQVLITEIRELRRALQEMAVNSSRVQIAVEKWRVQQAIAERATQELQNAQDQLDSENSTLRQLDQAAKQYQEQISAEPNPVQRAPMVSELQSVQTNTELVKQRIQRLQQREVEAKANASTEKAKAQEARDALDILEPSKK